jgi:heat shock protein HslJ
MRIAPLIATCICLAGCDRDETLRAYGAADKLWQVTELRDAPFTARATLSFPEKGRITGTGPCNKFTASQEVPYPWFRAGPISATRMACPDLEAETAFFTALSAATLSEVVGNKLILSNDAGVLLLFTAGE